MRGLYADYFLGMDLSQRILEVGPNNKPVFAKTEANVLYADVRPTDEVRAVFAASGSDVDAEAVELDFVIRESYAKSLAGVEPFDHVILCHVLEHIPRLIAFFQDIIKIMRPGGLLYLVLPDHRYCFDHFRQPTSFAEAYYVHSQKLPVSPWRVFDHHFMDAGYNVPALYWNESKLAQVILPFQKSSLRETRRHLENGGQDGIGPAHVSVFSPWSFLLLLFNLLRTRMVAFACDKFFPTQKDDFSFCAILRADAALPGDEGRLAAELKKIAALMDEQAPCRPAGKDAP